MTTMPPSDFGTARWCTAAEAEPLLTGRGRPIGVLNGRLLSFPSSYDTPFCSLGGANSGKFTRLALPQIVHDAPGGLLVLDVKGQARNTTWHWNLALGREAYAIDPMDTGHRLNPLSLLKKNKKLFANARLFADMLIPGVGGENAWVPKEARRWVTGILIYLVLAEGRATLPRLWELINVAASDDESWKSLSRATKDWPFKIYALFLEIYRNKHESPRQYGAVMGTIQDELLWLADPLLQDALSEEDLDLAVLADPSRKAAVYLVVPPEMMTGAWKSFVRVVVGAAMLACQRQARGARPLFLLDEAATCGGADFIKIAVSQCRNYLQTHLIYQSLGQIEHAFGAAGAHELRSSCDTQIMGGGIRTIDSSSILSREIGQASILVDDPVSQADRAHRAGNLMRQMLANASLDPLSDLRHERAQSKRSRQQGRSLLDESELLRLPGNKQILLLPSLGLPPLLCDKLPEYWRDRRLAGQYGPDPLHPPADKVRIAGRLGSRWARFIRQPVPDHLVHWPQHAHGEVTYVKGYRTW